MADNTYRRKNSKKNKSANKSKLNSHNKNQQSRNSSQENSQPRDYDKDINFAESENASTQSETTPVSEPLSYDDSTTDQQAVLVDLDENNDTSGSKALGIIAIVLGILIIAAGFTVYRFFSNQGTVETTDATPVEIVEDTSSDQVASDFDGIVLDDTENSNTWDELDGVIAHVPFVNRFRSNQNDSNNTSDTNQNAEEENTNDEYAMTDEENSDDVIMDGINLREIRSNSDTSDSSTIFETTTRTDQSNDTESTLERVETQTDQVTHTQTWTANNYNYGDVESGSTHTVVSGDTLWELAEGAYGDGSQWTQIAEANDVGYLSNGNPLIVPGQSLTIP